MPSASNRMSPNQREVLSAVSTLTFQQEYLSSTNRILNVNVISGGGGGGSVTQGTTPWVDNISQFGGSNVVTGTGVSGAGIPRVTVSSDSFPTTQAVSGSVSVSNFPATQPVSGTVTANAGSGTFNIQSNASVNLAQVTGTTTDVSTGNASAGTQRVVLATNQPAVAVTGSFFQTTQPVSATSLPLPTGASTSALQTTGNTSLSSIDTKLSGTLSTTGPVSTLSAVVNVGQTTSNTSAVQLSAVSTVPTNGIIVQALSGNTASVFIGSSGVSTSTGFELQAGQAAPFTANLNSLYVIGANNTDKVCWDVA